MAAGPELDLLISFALVLIAAEVGSLLFRFLRLPRMVGMLVAGAAIGPGINPYTELLHLRAESIQPLAFLGGIFLMFEIGLTFNVRTFRQVGSRALAMSLVGSLFSFLGGFVIALLFHRPLDQALYMALILTPTSSVIAFRLARDQNLLATRGIDKTMGSIILDDVVIIFFATLVLGVTAPRSPGGWIYIGLGLVLVGLLGSVIILLMLRALPRALHAVEQVSGGQPILLAVSLAFLLSYVFTRIGLPPIFGAFWAGSIIASSRFGDDVHNFAKPITELFSAVFFTAIGALLRPAALPLLGGLFVALILVGTVARLGAGFLSLRSFRTPLFPALACATLLVPRGEVSLVIAQYAGDPELVDQLQLLGSILMVATSLLAPLLFVGVRWVARRTERAHRSPPPRPDEAGAA